MGTLQRVASLEAGSIIRIEAGDGPVKRDVSAELRSARERLASLVGVKKAFAVVRLWPNQAVAEHENVERLRDAADLIGAKLIEIDRFGNLLNSPGDRITSREVDFVLHLHFETAKTYDALSIAAMWNPLKFYFEWGFDNYWSNQMSHDIYAFTGSEEIRGLVRAVHGGVAPEMPLLNHTLSDPIYVPAERARYQAFYCGINWEKIDGRVGRHDTVLKLLDARGRLDVYGPEKLRGVEVWAGYQGYRGSLPFDGKTIIRRIWDAGACLVFSSDAHKASNIMSNRLFEALAGGAVVFGDEHPFIRQAIGDNFISVPATLQDEARAEIIVEALTDFERNPGRAVAMATAAQDHLVRSMFLSTQLAGLFEASSRFESAQRRKIESTPGPIVDIVLQPLSAEVRQLTDQVETLLSSLGARAHLIILAPAEQVEWYQSKFGDRVSVAGSVSTRTILGPMDCLARVRALLKSGKICFLIDGVSLFADPFLSACVDFGTRAVGRTAYLIQHADASGEMHYDYKSPRRETKLHPAGMGSLVFDRAWLEQQPEIPGLSLEALLELADVHDDGTAMALAPSVVIDLRRYETNIHRRYEWTSTAVDEVSLLNWRRSIGGALSNSVVVQTKRVVGSAFGGDQLAKPLDNSDIPAAFGALTEEQKLGILLSLYHSVPLPGWMKAIITLARKAAGLRAQRKPRAISAR